MTFDAELRQALAPLAGDPEADAARVLAALEREPRRSWRPYWFPLLLAAAAIAGFALGFLLRPTPAPAPRQEPTVAAKEDFGPQLLMATGVVLRIHGDAAAKAVLPGARFAMGEEVETDAAAKAAFSLPCGSLLLADRGTRVAFAAPRQLELKKGHVLVDATGGDNPLIVRGSQGFVTVAEPGKIDVSSDDRDFAITALNQVARIETYDGVHRRVPKGNSAWIFEGAMKDPRMLEGPLATARWTFELWVPAGRTQDADQFIDELMTAADRPYFAEMVPMFRSLALRAMPKLFEYLDRTRGKKAPAENRISVMGLIAETSERRELEKLFEFLTDPEPVVRAMAAGAIHRITHDDGGAAKELWLDGPEDERRERIERWKARVLR